MMKTMLYPFLFGALTLCAGEKLITELPLPQRQRIFDKLAVFPRNHLKYNLNSDYFMQPGYWIDRPLFLGHYTEGEGDTGLGGSKAFADNVKIVRNYGCTGFACLVMDAYDSYIKRFEAMCRYAVREDLPPGILLPEVTIFRYTSFSESTLRDLSCINTQMLFDRLFKAANASPHVFRHNGKIVISSYMADSMPPAKWKQLLGELRAKYGDTFYFVAEVRNVFYTLRAPWSSRKGLKQTEIDKVKAVLRSYLDVCDGIHFAGVNHLASYPVSDHVDVELFRKIIVPLVAEVLNEKPYRNKLLGFGYVKGYLNNTGHNNIQEFGTTALRGTYEAALGANPDFMVGVEWNEISENTSLEPTCYDGRTNEHLFRHYSGLAPSAGSNGLPTLILSTPAHRLYGHKLHLELLNIPDNTAWNKGYQAQLHLVTPQGKRAWSSPVCNFPAKRFCTESFDVPSEKFAPAQWVRPEIDLIAADGKKQTVKEGLAPIRFSGTMVSNFKDIRTPLRDLITVKSLDFKVKNTSDGTLVSLKCEASVPLRFAEIQRNGETVGSFSMDVPPAGEKQYELLWNGWNCAQKSYPLITVTAEKASVTGAKDRYRGWRSMNISTAKQSIEVRNPALRPGPHYGIIFRLRPDSANAALKLDLGGKQYRFALDELKNGGVLLSMEDAVEFRLREVREVVDTPRVLNNCKVSGKLDLAPSLPGDLYELWLIGMDGSLYRSAPVRIPGNEETQTQKIFSKALNRNIPIPVVKALRPVLEYDFDAPSHGYLKVKGAADWRFNAILGGGAGYDYPFLSPGTHPAGHGVCAPARVKTDGVNALQFDGKGTYLCFPAEAVPTEDFRIDFTIMPEAAEKQILLASKGNSTGTIVEFSLQGGDLALVLFNRRYERKTLQTKNAPVKLHAWNRISLRCNAEGAAIAVNGKQEAFLPFTGYEANRAQVLIFGGRDRKSPFFKGKLSQFVIR